MLGQLLRTPIVVQRIRWKGWPVGRIVALRVQYVDLAAAAYGPQIAWSIAQSVQQALGQPYAVDRHHQAKRQVWVAEKAPTPEQTPTALEAQEQRVRDVVAETFGADAKVEITATKDDLVTGFAIDYRSAAPRATVVAVRRRLSNAVGERLTGQWKVNFDLENDRVSFKRRPPLPTYMARSSTPPPKPGDASFNLIPQAVDEEGEIVSWDIAGVTSHCLKSGRTRTGKALDKCTPIATPSGWTTMGSLEVGDFVFDETGTPSLVAGVYDQPPGSPCVNVTFSDGSTIVCDKAHLWWTETRAARVSRQQSRRTRQRRTVLTEELIINLRTRADSAEPTEEVSVSDVIPLLGGEVSDVWVYQVAARLEPTSSASKQRWFTYQAQTIQQHQTRRTYAAGRLFGVLAILSTAGRFPGLSELSENLTELATAAPEAERLTAKQIAEALGVAQWRASRWIEATEIEGYREAVLVERKIEARRVRRPGGRFDDSQPPSCSAPLPTLEAGDAAINSAIGFVVQFSTTREIAETLTAATGHLNHSVPVAAALQLPDADIPVPPYTVGAFLGDGHSATGRLTSADPEVPAQIAADGFVVTKVALASDALTRARVYKIDGLRFQLKQLDLISRPTEPCRKRIPAAYLRGSEQQRRDLLAGLLDTDGTVAPQGTTQYTTVSRGLADDVLELAISLGYRATSIEGRATLYGRDIGPKWTIAFTTNDPVFRLPRKLQALEERTANHAPERVRNRMIVSVRPVASRPLRCITVDSPNHLYLAGRSMIPTHNTITLLGDVVEAARRGFKVFVLDPKRVEFLGLRGWPNVQLVATTVPEQVALVHMLKLEMDERYRRVEEDGFDDANFEPILFVIDEYRQFYGNVRAWWRSIEVPGMPAECPVFDEIGMLLRMAAYCRIHVDLATQRPDAEFLGGEALAIDTPIPTPAGWSTMGELKVGQQVFDNHGLPTLITAATDVMVGRPCYRVTFSDSTSLIADHNHQWKVCLQPKVATHDAAAAETLTTAQLASIIKHAQNTAKVMIMAAQPLQLPTRSLPIDPSVLGHHLAERALQRSGPLDHGSAREVRGPELDEVLKAMFPVGHVNPAAVDGGQAQRRSPLMRDYLRASATQRATLLTGLLRDGRRDGTNVAFTTGDCVLAEFVSELAATLGLIPTLWCGADSRPRGDAPNRMPARAWTVMLPALFGHLVPMMIDAEAGLPPIQARRVVAITPVAPVAVRCITVAADSHLYLAGRSFIPTHNCRDNFSARAATGRLSPDGAEMMFNNSRIGVNIPIHVRGRGTIVGADDQPKEVQFLYTPDPRRATSRDDQELLAALRPETTTWPPLAMRLPALEEFADEITEPKKISIEWEQLQRARFEPVTSDFHDDPESTEIAEADPTSDVPVRGDGSDDADLDDAYRAPSMVPAGMVSIGDLLDVNDGEHAWVTVTDIARDGGASSSHGEVQLEWRNDDGAVGELIVGRGELLEIRRLQT